MKASPLLLAAALGAALPLAAAPLAAQEPTALPGQDRTYVVRRGDTLWDIARGCLGDPFLWPELYRMNAGVVRDPARIFPNQRLTLPECRQGADPQVAFTPRRGEDPRPGNSVLPAAGTADVPVIAPGDFYRARLLVQDGEVPAVGRLVERISPTVVPIGMTPMISLYDRVYVTLGSGGGLRVGDAVHFFRRDREVRPYGRVYVSTGMGSVEALEGNVATVEVRTLYDLVAVNDLAVPAARFPVPAGVAPRPTRQPLEARIVGFGIPHAVQATGELAFLDVGAAAGVKPGDVFAAYLPRTQRDWGTRPEIPVARMQVVRVTDRTATVRITGLEHPALEPGITVRRVAEMP
ncbi:MAG TPA: LysM peptidoglycan-binding domain-containing protein [Longimicrobiaceae bacterium]|nr:LysM peptidoglycan-binding domain-containing protein [Longimicrobiaceae bacterium]